MSSAVSKDPAYYKNKIEDEEKKKLQKIFEIIQKDQKAEEFLKPVDYIGLNLLDYPKIISHPMDLGTVRINLENGEYETFQDLMSDLNLIWRNCRTYNIPGSEIVKMANHCDKRMKSLIDKQFKNMKPKVDSSKSKKEKEKEKGKEIASLSLSEKAKLIENIREQTNEGLTQIVKTILKECPKALEDIDNEKLQIKIDLLDLRTYDLINQYLQKNNNDKNKSAKK
jgi:hypothetical protein